MTTSLSAAAAAAATASEKAAATIAADARQRLLRLHHQHQQQQKARGGAAKAAGRGGSQEGREEAEPAAHHDAVDGDHGRGYHAFAAADLAPLRASLLAWYDAHRRDLPWRKPSPRFLPRVDATVPPASSSSSRRPAPPSDPQDDPDLRSRLGQRAYEVWVSEIMLQQTQVVTVIDYYNRWMATWPTVFDLAKADLEAVNQKWSGLGYYSRARRLLAAAQKVVSKFDGILPSDVVALQKEVPGVGRYTAGAISSIAFNEPQPIVDGNVVRVVSRLRAIGGDPKSKAAVSLHWKLAEDLVDPDRPGDFNQAMMELGATVCTPQNPSCQGCPVAAFCRALAESKAHAAIAKENLSGTQNEDLVQCDLCQPLDIEDFAVTRYPAAVKRKAAREEDCFVVILEYAETDDTPPSYLLIQRPKSGLLPNLWDFPHVRTPKKAIADDDEEREEEKEEEAAESEPAGPLGAAAATRLLQETVGIRLDDGASVTVRERRDLGTAVHVFSHIRWSMRVELVRVGPGTAGRGRPEPVVVATARGAGGGGGSRTRGSRNALRGGRRARGGGAKRGRRGAAGGGGALSEEEDEDEDEDEAGKAEEGNEGCDDHAAADRPQAAKWVSADEVLGGGTPATLKKSWTLLLKSNEKATASGKSGKRGSRAVVDGGGGGSADGGARKRVKRGGSEREAGQATLTRFWSRGE